MITYTHRETAHTQREREGERSNTHIHKEITHTIRTYIVYTYTQYTNSTHT